MNFIYKTVNRKNGKIYIGSHNGEEDDSYLGSGKLFLKALNKYGKENFIRETITECLPEENLLLEEKYINEYNSLQPYGYNISPTGGHGLNGKMSDETKKKISKANKGKIRTNEMRANISKAAKGKRVGEKHPFYGKHHTKKTIKQISESRKGLNSGVDHQYFGKSRDEKTREKIRESLKGKSPSEETRGKLSDAAKNVKKVVCSHCNKEFTPWGFARHKKALSKRDIYIN